MRFRYWNAGPRSGAYHMAVDRVLYRRMEAGLSDPMIRVYTWEPWCVTLGYAQNPERELHLDKIAALGWTWCKRPTGGRAVLHAHEFTYTVAAPVSAAPWCAHRDRSYARIGEALQELLRKVGLNADLERGDSVMPIGGLGPTKPCFASTSRLELTAGGRKLVGSAQRRGRQAFVQHGSMPLHDGYLDIVEVLPLSEQKKSAYRADLQSHAVSLEAALGRRVDFAEAAHSASAAFAQGLGIECSAAGLTPEEAAEVEEEWVKNPFGHPLESQPEEVG